MERIRILFRKIGRGSKRRPGRYHGLKPEVEMDVISINSHVQTIQEIDSLSKGLRNSFSVSASVQIHSNSSSRGSSCDKSTQTDRELTKKFWRFPSLHHSHSRSRRKMTKPLVTPETQHENRDIRGFLRKKQPDKQSLIKNPQDASQIQNQNQNPTLLEKTSAFLTSLPARTRHGRGIENPGFTARDNRVYRETTTTEFDSSLTEEEMPRYREEMSEADPLRGSDDWTSNPERNGLFRRHTKSLQWAIFFGALAVSALVFFAVLAIVLQARGFAPSLPLVPNDAIPANANVNSPLPEHAPLASTAMDVQALLTRSWPLEDLKAREGAQLLKSPLSLLGPEASADVVSVGVKAGNEARESKARVEKKLLQLGMKVPPSSPSARLTVMDVPTAADEDGRRANAGFFMDKASQSLSQQLKLTKAEAQGGIATEEIKDFHPNEFCPSLTTVPSVVCNSSDLYRSFDGSCNNLRHTTWGSSNSPYRRILLPDYADGISMPRVASDGSALPNPRLVSRTVFNSDTSDAPLATFMLVLWGHFVDHDLAQTAISTGLNNEPIACCGEGQLLALQHPECLPFTMTPKDQFYGPIGEQCTNFVRSAPSPICEFGPREQDNKITAFLDASTLYGSTFNESKAARRGFPIPVEPEDGRLPHSWIADGRPLPYRSVDLNDGCNRPEEVEQKKFCFRGGDKRINEYIGTTAMHLVWSRQHNEIVEHLMSMNFSGGSNILFQESRRIVIAQIQHITYNEFLPLLLGPSVMKSSGLQLQTQGYYLGYDPKVDPTISNAFSTAAFRMGHSMIQGLIKMVGPRWKNEDFVQIHKLFYDPFPLYELGKMDAILRGHAAFPSGRADTHFSKQVTEHLFQRNGSYGLDLAAIDIQRGRDHGISNYISWRATCGLSEVKDFSDLTGIWSLESVHAARSVYKTVYDIDLYVGGLAENPVPDGMLGPTFACIVADQFLRLKKGDRFWYESNVQLKPFTAAQLQSIRKTRLAHLLCVNADNLEMIQERVMERQSATNPRQSCNNFLLDSAYYEPWRESLPKPTPDKDSSSSINSNTDKDGDGSGDKAGGNKSKNKNKNNLQLKLTLTNETRNNITDDPLDSLELEDDLFEEDETEERYKKEKEKDRRPPTTTTVNKPPGKRNNKNIVDFSQKSVPATQNNDNNSKNATFAQLSDLAKTSKEEPGSTGAETSERPIDNGNGDSGNDIEFQNSDAGIIINWHRRQKRKDVSPHPMEEEIMYGS